jgi:hypothetical protein
MPLNDPDRLLKTTDAEVWAEEFCYHVGEKIPAIKAERECVFAWFANAITAGELAGRRDAEGGSRPPGDVDLAFQLDRARLLLDQFNIPGLFEDAAREIKRLQAEVDRLRAAVPPMNLDASVLIAHTGLGGNYY